MLKLLLVLTLAAQPVRLFTVPQYTEGIVFDHDGAGYVSHGKTITRFTLDGKHETWAETGGPNGHKILADGTHLVCDRSHRAVLHLSSDGKILHNAADKFEGKPLLGPNDLTLDVANGGFYFTDPEGSDKDLIGAVYYVTGNWASGAGNVRMIDAKMGYPNGIALTPDGKRLYVGESVTNQVHVYDVSAPGKVRTRKLFVQLPAADKSKGQIANAPDGMCLDAAGNLYVAHFGMKHVHKIDPSGKIVASYDAGNVTASNVAFGGERLDQLFVSGALDDIKSTGAVHRLDLGVKGLRVLPAK